MEKRLMTQNQIPTSSLTPDGYHTPQEQDRSSSVEPKPKTDSLMDMDVSKVEFRFASITQKIIDKISESKKNTGCASSANLGIDTK